MPAQAEKPVRQTEAEQGLNGSQESDGTASAPARVQQAGRRQGAPLACRMAGCTQQLRRSYNQVHRICAEHRKSLRIVAEDGSVWRFCLQCAKLHTIDQFSGDRRSCQSSLLLRRQRKRQRQLAEKDDREETLRHCKRKSSHSKRVPAAARSAAPASSEQSTQDEEGPAHASDGSNVAQIEVQTGVWGGTVEQSCQVHSAGSQSQQQMSTVLSGPHSMLSASSSGTYWSPTGHPQHTMPLSYANLLQQQLSHQQQPAGGPSQPMIVVLQVPQQPQPLPEWQRGVAQHQQPPPHERSHQLLQQPACLALLAAPRANVMPPQYMWDGAPTMFLPSPRMQPPSPLSQALQALEGGGGNSEAWGPGMRKAASEVDLLNFSQDPGLFSSAEQLYHQAVVSLRPHSPLQISHPPCPPPVQPKWACRTGVAAWELPQQQPWELAGHQPWL